MDLDVTTAKALTVGGCLLGGGGGGGWRQGLELLELALGIGRPRLIDLDACAPGDLLVTVSGVGAPGAPEPEDRVADYVAAVELLRSRMSEPVAGLISSENGGFSSANGFVQSAMTGLPVVDAPGNGRAHPTGVMGSMGLHRQPYVSCQAAVGGAPGKNRVELFVQGDLRAVDHVVRQAAVAAGGMVAVARNPVAARYVADHGAPGALKQALALGEVVLAHVAEGAAATAEAVAAFFGAGALVAEGEVTGYRLTTAGGYDTGALRVGPVRLTFWNEYMSCHQEGRERAAFPDLIFTLDAESALPLTSAEVRNGSRVVVGIVPGERLLLGAGVRDPDILAGVAGVVQAIPDDVPD